MIRLSTLTRSHVEQTVRLAWLIGGTCVLIALLWLFVALPEQPAPGTITQAAPGHFVSDSLLFSSYSELTSVRATLFEFQDLVTVQVQTRQRQPEPQPQAAPVMPVALPPALPDTLGLLLVGTAPGDTGTMAMLRDEQTTLTFTVSVGDQVRNAVVKEIRSDRIVLSLDEQQSELSLMPIFGSENLDRQLSGLPPLTPAQGRQQPLAEQATAVASFPGGTRAVLGGVGPPGGGGTPAAVITQAAAPIAGAMDQGADNTAQAVDSPDLNAAVPAEQPTASESSAASANRSSDSSAQGRSLGISGHMLTLAVQQDLGLSQTGLMVTAVYAEDSAIQVGDIVLSIGGKAFSNLAEAKAIIDDVQGNTANLQLFRDGSTTSVTANLN